MNDPRFYAATDILNTETKLCSSDYQRFILKSKIKELVVFH